MRLCGYSAMKMMLKMKTRSHRYDINRRRLRHGQKYAKNKMRLSILMVIYIKQDLSKATFEDQFLKKLSYTEAELKKCFAY